MACTRFVASLTLLVCLQSASCVQQRAAKPDPQQALFRDKSSVDTGVDLASAFERLATSRIDQRVEQLEESLHEAEKRQADAAAARKAAYDKAFAKQSSKNAEYQKTKTKIIEDMTRTKLENEALRNKAKELQGRNKHLTGLLGGLRANVSLALDFINLTITRSYSRFQNSSVRSLLSGEDNVSNYSVESLLKEEGNVSTGVSLLQIAGGPAASPIANVRTQADLLTQKVSDAIAVAADHESKSVNASVTTLNAMLAAGETRMNETKALIDKLDVKLQQELTLRKRLAIAVGTLQQKNDGLKKRLTDFSEWATDVAASVAPPSVGA